MKSIKIIILTSISLLILTVVVLGILNVVNIYTMEEVLDNFLKSLYVILIIAVGLSLVSVVTSFFKNK